MRWCCVWKRKRRSGGEEEESINRNQQRGAIRCSRQAGTSKMGRRSSLHGDGGEAISARLEFLHDGIVLLGGRNHHLDHGSKNLLVDLGSPLLIVTRHRGDLE